MSFSTLSTLPAFIHLQQHAFDASDWHMRNLFVRWPERFPKMTVEGAGLFMDYSKNLVNDETVQLLCEFARACSVEVQRDAMLAGEHINITEDRAVLHTALRAPRDQALVVDGQDVTGDVHGVLDRMRDFSNRVRGGEWRGYSGKPISDVVNIGIGGSDLGPKMVCQALRSYAQANLTMHFVSNVDGHDLDAVLSKVDPETTLFIITSKTFTTMETMLNAHSARNWFLRHASEAALPKHFVAVSTNAEAVQEFGIDTDNMFPFWDWVGGRYSVWSAVGLPVMLSVGPEHFADFLAGAHAMDKHFCEAPLNANMPVMLALIGVWNRDLMGTTSLSIAPYHQDLARFPAYLQQLEMESNGKSVTTEGDMVEAGTCPVIWGDCGTNGQHAYFQLLHQGTDIVSIDFIAALKPSHGLPGHHAALLANCFAQAEAFMRGKTEDEVRVEMREQGVDEAEIEKLVPHSTFHGNRPSNMILMDELTPATLGALIALYEHKVFVQGVIWDINSFDQWGVELGKVLARNIQGELNGEAEAGEHDSSTNGLIALAKAAGFRPAPE